MSTPIYDFLKKYAEGSPTRLHMPGHKGVGPLGVCSLDLTEISGADSLYRPEGIILESERAASKLFGSYTCYSTEGSSQSIRAMLYLASLHAKETGGRAKILAGRNAHRAFISAAALLDFDIEWFSGESDSYLHCAIDAEAIRKKLKACDELPTAVYITSPDYLGFIADIGKIAEACHEFGVLLLVDNAHGAYLKFLSESLHPIDLGADMCCDSAHKTLGALTGGAYLHISYSAPELLRAKAKDALLLFGSTSPSYLILASLDLLNDSLRSLSHIEERAIELKKKISNLGYTTVGDEPLKITLLTKPYGYLGTELCRLLEESGIFAEFCDSDYAVFMISEHNTAGQLDKLVSSLAAIKRREPILSSPPPCSMPTRALSVREALFTQSETVSVDDCLGRVMAEIGVSCPPAVPIAVSGEIIDANVIDSLRYYGISRVSVVKKSCDKR